jgi:hypothetical protein
MGMALARFAAEVQGRIAGFARQNPPEPCPAGADAMMLSILARRMGLDGTRGR